MTKRILALISFTVIGAIAFGQDLNIESYLSRIEGGDAEEVRAELPSLLQNNPNNPGVFYLQALLTTDGAEAVRMYQNIVDQYPKSDWADDALWKVHKFYSAIGLYRTAEIKLQQLKANYPGSKYLTGREEPRIVAEQRAEPSSQPAKQNPEPLVPDAGGKKPEPMIGTPPGTAAEKKEPEDRPKHVAAKPIDVPPVETQSVETVAAPKKLEAAPGPKYTLQVGVYSSQANAVRQKQFFEYQRRPAEIVRKMKGAKDLFCVYVGSFATAEDAQAAGNDLKRAFNIDFVVTTR